MRTYRTSQPLIEGALCSRTWDRNQQDAMRGDFTTETRRSRLRNALIVSQVTICVLLLICAGVLLRTGRSSHPEPATASIPPGTIRPKRLTRRTLPPCSGRTVLASEPQPKRAHACTTETPSGQSAVSR